MDIPIQDILTRKENKDSIQIMMDLPRMKEEKMK
jgi:hypothetical protein